MTPRNRVLLALSGDWTKTADIAVRAKVRIDLGRVYLRELLRAGRAERRETGPRGGLYWWKIAPDEKP